MNYKITIGFNHDKSTKQENFLCGKNLLLIDVHKVSSVLAQKLRCPSSAQLGSARLSSGNFSSNSSLPINHFKTLILSKQNLRKTGALKKSKLASNSVQSPLTCLIASSLLHIYFFVVSFTETGYQWQRNRSLHWCCLQAWVNKDHVMILQLGKSRVSWVING